MTSIDIETLLTIIYVLVDDWYEAKVTCHALKQLLRRDFGIDVQSFSYLN